MQFGACQKWALYINGGVEHRLFHHRAPVSSQALASMVMTTRLGGPYGIGCAISISKESRQQRASKYSLTAGTAALT